MGTSFEVVKRTVVLTMKRVSVVVLPRPFFYFFVAQTFFMLLLVPRSSLRICRIPVLIGCACSATSPSPSRTSNTHTRKKSSLLVDGASGEALSRERVLQHNCPGPSNPEDPCRRTGEAETKGDDEDDALVGDELDRKKRGMFFVSGYSCGLDLVLL